MIKQAASGASRMRGIQGLPRDDHTTSIKTCQKQKPPTYTTRTIRLANQPIQPQGVHQSQTNASVMASRRTSSPTQQQERMLFSQFQLPGFNYPSYPSFMKRVSVYVSAG